MEIFEGDESTKEDASFLCNGEFGLNCSVAGEIPWVCVCIDSWCDVGDAWACVILQVENVWKAMIYLYLDR